MSNHHFYPQAVLAVLDELNGKYLPAIDAYADVEIEGDTAVVKLSTNVANEQAKLWDHFRVTVQRVEATHCGSAYLVRKGLTVWCGNGHACDGNHRAYTGEAEWTEQDSTAEYLCPRCENWGQWTDGQSKATGEDVDEFWCQKCSTESPLSACSKRLRSRSEATR